MFPTVEVRWFFKDAIYDNLNSKMLADSQNLEKQPLRVDYYYDNTSSGSMGIKIREKRIEIKNRKHDYGITRISDHFEGKVEQWYKWGFDISVINEDYQNIAKSNSSWIEVKKERKLCKYMISDDKKVKVLSLSEYSTNACNFEITDIVIEGKKCHSIGFESYGDEGSLYENLILVVREVLLDKRLLSFKADNSFGYPQWIDLFLEA